MPPAVFITSATDNGGSSFAFATPSSAKLLDSLIVIVAVSDHSSTISWDPAGTDFTLLATLETVPAGSSAGQVFIGRRIINGAEPLLLSVNLNANPTTFAGAMMMYRGLDPVAALVESGIVDIAASVNFTCPSRTLTHYSDLYIGVAFSKSAAPTFTPPAGTTERIEFNGAGGKTLEIFDVLLEAPGASGIKTSVANTAQSGVAASVLLAATGVAGTGKIIRLDPAGTIGLPTIGV